MTFPTIAVEARGLACRRGGRRVFSGLDATLGSGEALVVTGRNGAGKSSLLLILAGLLRPGAGTVRATGTGDRRLGECAHLAAHRDALKTALTARENLAFAAALLGRSGFGAAAVTPEAALDTVGLSGAAELPVGYLSAGQRRRVALARLLVAPRPLWLLDEPAAALDVASQAMLARLMASHLEASGLIVATTHAPLDLPTARELKLGADTAPSLEHDPFDDAPLDDLATA